MKTLAFKNKKGASPLNISMSYDDLINPESDASVRQIGGLGESLVHVRLVGSDYVACANLTHGGGNAGNGSDDHGGAVVGLRHHGIE